MSKITEYMVCSMELRDGFLSESTTSNDFTKLINQRIKEGWQPFGELRTSISGGGSFMGNYTNTVLSQVMVKYEEAEL